MVSVILNEANRLGVKRLGRTLVTDLIKQDGAVAGAVGFNTFTGDFYVFKARAVVLATGEGGWKGSYHSNTSTGEGLDMALRAGAELKNCEFARVWNVPARFSWEGQAGLLPLGAKFVNARGDRFMDIYCPSLGSNTDPHFNVMGMALEAREGRGPFYLDCSAMKPEDIEVMKPKAGWVKLNYEKLLKLGIDIFKQKTEWMPQIMTSFAGIVVDKKGRTGVPGLFAAGTTWATDPGLYMGGWNLCKTAVTGYIVGESAGEYAREHGPVQIVKGVEELRERLYAPMVKKGIPPKAVLAKIQEVVFPYDVSILKNKASLERALGEIENIRDELMPQMTAEDAHYLLKLVEVRGVLRTTEVFLNASLMRTESRAGHYREDYPNRDDKNWLKWILINQDKGKLLLRSEPLLMDKYKFQPSRYYTDAFNFHV